MTKWLLLDNDFCKKLTRYYVWVDSLYEKICVGYQVKNLAIAVVAGIDENGKRDIWAIEPMYKESEVTYQSLFENIKNVDLRILC